MMIKNRNINYNTKQVLIPKTPPDFDKYLRDATRKKL